MTHVWTGGALQEGSVLLNRQASRAMWVTSSRSRREDRCSIASFLSRRPWRGMGSQPCMITPLIRPFLLFDRAAGFLPPRPQDARPARAEAVKADPVQGHPKGLGLESIEHDGTLAQLGSLRGLGGWFRHFPDLEVVTVMQHTPGDARELVGERDRQHVVV